MNSDFRIGYQASVACLLMDRFQGANFKDYGIRNDAANQILSLIFGKEYKAL